MRRDGVSERQKKERGRVSLTGMTLCRGSNLKKVRKKTNTKRSIKIRESHGRSTRFQNKMARRAARLGRRNGIDRYQNSHGNPAARVYGVSTFPLVPKKWSCCKAYLSCSPQCCDSKLWVKIGARGRRFKYNEQIGMNVFMPQGELYFWVSALVFLFNKNAMVQY